MSIAAAVARIARLFPMLALSAALSTQATAQTAATNSLYKRLGGYDAIAAVTDDFIGRLAAEPSIAPMFKGHSQHSLGRIRQLVVEQVCAATGGPCVYIGRDMKTAHKGLGITEAQWETAVRLFTATLDKFNVPAKEKGELLGIVGTLKGDIVETSM